MTQVRQANKLPQNRGETCLLCEYITDVSDIALLKGNMTNDTNNNVSGRCESIKTIQLNLFVKNIK